MVLRWLLYHIHMWQQPVFPQWVSCYKPFPEAPTSQDSTHNCFTCPCLNQPSIARRKEPPWLASRPIRLHFSPETWRKKVENWKKKKKKSLSVKRPVSSQRKNTFKPIPRQAYWLRVFISNLHWYISKLPQACLRTIVWEMSPYSHHQDRSSVTNKEGMG